MKGITRRMSIPRAACLYLAVDRCCRQGSRNR